MSDHTGTDLRSRDSVCLITALLALAVTTFAQAQNLIKSATAPVSFSKSDFADTIKIKVTADSLVFGDINKKSRQQVIYQFTTIKMGSLCIENYPMIVEDAMNEFICNRFDGVIGFNLVGMGLSFKLDTKDCLLIGQSADSIFPELVRRH